MEKFNLIDLDKVLDEFEKTEEDPETSSVSFAAVVPANPAALTWPRGADKRSSPPSIRAVPVTSPSIGLDGGPSAVGASIRPSSLKVQPAHLGNQRAAACVSNSELNLPDDQTSVSSSGYDSLRTSSEFIVSSQEYVGGIANSGLNLATSVVPEEITPTVEREDTFESFNEIVSMADREAAAHHYKPPSPTAGDPVSAISSSSSSSSSIPRCEENRLETPEGSQNRSPGNELLEVRYQQQFAEAGAAPEASLLPAATGDDLAASQQRPEAVEAAGEEYQSKLPAVALDNYALRPDLVHESASTSVDLVPTGEAPAVVSFATAEALDESSEIDESELNSYLGLEAREEPEGTEETLPDVAASCNSLTAFPTAPVPALPAADGEVSVDVSPDPSATAAAADARPVDPVLPLGVRSPGHEEAAGVRFRPSASDTCESSSPPDIVDVERVLGQPDLIRGEQGSEVSCHDYPCSLGAVMAPVGAESQPALGLEGNFFDDRSSARPDGSNPRPAPSWPSQETSAMDEAPSDSGSRIALVVSSPTGTCRRQAADGPGAAWIQDNLATRVGARDAPHDTGCRSSPTAEKRRTTTASVPGANATLMVADQRPGSMATGDAGDFQNLAVPTKKARPNTLFGLMKPTLPSESLHHEQPTALLSFPQQSPSEGAHCAADRSGPEPEHGGGGQSAATPMESDDAPKPRRPTWLALPSRSLSTDSGGGTSSSTLTPGPAGLHVSPMSESTVTPSVADASPEAAQLGDGEEMDVSSAPVEPAATARRSSMDKVFEEDEEEEEEDDEEEADAEVEPSQLPPSTAVLPHSAHLVPGVEPTPFSPDLGRVAPVWVHDRDAPTCMGCCARFTLTRRRHHCRACGKVFCSLCCSHKAKMHFLDGKEARVCAVCFQHLIRLESSANRADQPVGAVGGACAMVEDCNNPTSALRGSRRRSALGRNVVFADGIRPGGDLSESDPSARVTTPSRPTAPTIEAELSARPVDCGDEFCFLSGLAAESFLPIVICHCPDLQIDVEPDIVGIAERLSLSASIADRDSGETENERTVSDAVRFAVTRHLHVITQRVLLSCCVGMECWVVSTRGLTAYGQSEIVIVLQCLPDEMLPPIDLYRFLYEVYTAVKKGEVFNELNCLLTGVPFLGSKENAGFLFIRPTYQCLEQLPLPDTAQYLIGILIQRWEAPLAKLFPLRLLLRLGHQYRYYPCPIFSTRDRGPVYEAPGVTLLQLLVDFRNFSYTIPAIAGLRVHLSPGGITRVKIPRTSYSTVMRAISNMDSHVLALGAAFSSEADSHLVCVHSDLDDGSYTTQAISIHNRFRQVTGSSFLILNGGVRHCKSSIVEDGVMVHMSAQQFAECLNAMKSMREFVLQCNSPTAGSGSVPEQLESGSDDTKDEVQFQWTDDSQSPTTHCLASPRPVSWIDGAHLDEPSMSAHRAPVSLRQCAATGEHQLLWTRLYVLKLPAGADADPFPAAAGEPVDPLQLGQEMAAAVGKALHSHLSKLFAHSEGSRALALRVRLNSDSLVDFDMAARAPEDSAWVRAVCCADLDSELVPLLINRTGAVGHGSVAIELEFHVVE